MTVLPGGVERRILLRSLAVQGSWNYETLIGAGFAYTLLPALRLVYSGDRERLLDALRRHADIFNSHPYLATVAAGAVARLEADAVAPQVIERFKSALRGSLGSLGDQLIWGAWRPATLLLALVLALSGAAWWVGVTVFLLLYNLLHLGLRAWGLRLGLRTGLQVGKALRDAPLQPLAARAADAGALFCGLGVALVVAPAGTAGTDWVQVGVALAGAAAGAWLGSRTRTVAALAVGLTWALAIILGLID